MGNDLSPLGQLPSTERKSSQEVPVPVDRGWVTFGLRTRPLGTQTIQVTGGDDATDTFIVTDNGVAIMAETGWSTSHNATAALIAQAINTFRAANPTVSNWVATAATDTVTIMQIRSGAANGTIACTVTNDATVTIANSGNPSNDTDTWTEFVSGATFDGDLYYELGFSGALVLDAGTHGGNAESDLSAARLRALDMYCDGQALQLWSGGLRANSGATAIVQGIPVASQTWLSAALGAPWAWLDAATPLIIKVASDEELLYHGDFF